MSTTATDGLDDLVGLRDGFDTTWRGYVPAQVDRFLERVDHEMDTLINDRDNAYHRCHDLVTRLAVLGVENDRLRDVIDRISRTPVDRDGLDIRLTRMVELAEAQVAEAAASAADIADNQRRATESHTARLREREKQVQASCERVERDFAIAMRSRRAEAMREIQSQLDAAKADREAALVERRAATADRAAARAERHTATLIAANLRPGTGGRHARENLRVVIPEQRDPKPAESA